MAHQCYTGEVKVLQLLSSCIEGGMHGTSGSFKVLFSSQ